MSTQPIHYDYDQNRLIYPDEEDEQQNKARFPNATKINSIGDLRSKKKNLNNHPNYHNQSNYNSNPPPITNNPNIQNKRFPNGNRIRTPNQVRADNERRRNFDNQQRGERNKAQMLSPRKPQDIQVKSKNSDQKNFQNGLKINTPEEIRKKNDAKLAEELFRKVEKKYNKEKSQEHPIFKNLREMSLVDMYRMNPFAIDLDRITDLEVVDGDKKTMFHTAEKRINLKVNKHLLYAEARDYVLERIIGGYDFIKSRVHYRIKNDHQKNLVEKQEIGKIVLVIISIQKMKKIIINFWINLF